MHDHQSKDAPFKAQTGSSVKHQSRNALFNLTKAHLLGRDCWHQLAGDADITATMKEVAS